MNTDETRSSNSEFPRNQTATAPGTHRRATSGSAVLGASVSCVIAWLLVAAAASWQMSSWQRRGVAGNFHEGSAKFPIAAWLWSPKEENALVRQPAIATTLVSAVLAPDGRRGIVIGGELTVLATTNGGRTWQRRAQGTDAAIAAAAFSSTGEIGWAVGEHGAIMITDDGGSTWASSNSGTQKSLNAVSFSADGRRGWAVGVDGIIVATSNGARSWRFQVSGTTANLTGVAVSLDGTRGWIVGEDGLILSTSDGGQTWQSQRSGTKSSLYAVTFGAQGNRGWAVGADGTILVTSDGGVTWNVQHSGTDVRLTAIKFAADNQQGWIVGRLGTILATTDGGRSWQQQVSGTSQDFLSVAISPNGLTGWAVGDEGTLDVTVDGGNSWQSMFSLPILANSIALGPDGMRAWLAGEGGTVLASTDGGATWTRRLSGTTNSLCSVAFTRDGQRGWMAGQSGTLLTTFDGGRGWRPLKSDMESFFEITSIAFSADGRRGWMLGSSLFGPSPTTCGEILSSPGIFFALEGEILRSSQSFATSVNGGRSWQEQPIEFGAVMNSIAMTADGRAGLAVGENGTVLSTADGGQSWRHEQSGTRAALNAVALAADGRHSMAVGERGTVLVSADGGRTWSSAVSGSTTTLLAVSISNDGRYGWATGMDGSIVATTDGGNSWQPQATNVGVPLTAVAFGADHLHGVAAGLTNILWTKDGGRAWNSIRYRIAPAPWFYLGLFLIPFVALMYARIRTRRPAPSPAIEDRMHTDAPLESTTSDALGFGDLANGLTRFLRNGNTQPPLTIALTGDWGSGKSSLMNFVRNEMCRQGVSTVSFNAWHHQRESSMLAVLLEAIKQQGLPGWRTPLIATRFRCRLLLRRWQKAPWVAATLAFIFGLAIANIAFFPDAFTIHTIREVYSVFRNCTVGDGCNGALRQLAEHVNVILTALLLIPLLLLWASLSIIPPLIHAFPTSSSYLLATLAGKFKLHDLEQQTAFRNRFAKHFSDVTEALGPRWMLIFVDDVDRCQPDKALEVLEAINYLVSSGKCFVVLGLARDWVERLIGIASERIAQETPDSAPAEGSYETVDVSTKEKNHRKAFANAYLEKLINIEIAVPTAENEDSFRLLLRPELIAGPSLNRFDRIWISMCNRIRQIAPYCVAVIALVAAILLASPIATETRGLLLASTGPQSVQETIATTPAASHKPAAIERAATTSNRVGKARDKLRQQLAFTDSSLQSSPRWPWALNIVLSVAMLGYGAFRLFQREQFVLQDSEEFENALDVWRPVVKSVCKTPRSVKRFLNRTRFFAMACRYYEPPPTPTARFRLAARRVADLLRRRVGHTATQQLNRFDDSAIVALSAIVHSVPEALSWVLSVSSDKHLEASSNNGHRQLLTDILAEHKRVFSGWPPDQSLVGRFQYWAKSFIG